MPTRDLFAVTDRVTSSARHFLLCSGVLSMRVPANLTLNFNAFCTVVMDGVVGKYPQPEKKITSQNVGHLQGRHHGENWGGIVHPCTLPEDVPV